MSRLLLEVVKAMTDKPSVAVIAGDSQCTIAALEKSGDSLDPTSVTGCLKLVKTLKNSRPW